MRDKLMMYGDLEDEFNFQEHWFKILLRGKFIIQDLPDESIILIVSKLNARSFVRLIQTCKWVYDLIREKRPKITIFNNILSASDSVFEKREEKNVNIVIVYQFILRSDRSQIIGNKEGIDLQFLETWDSRDFMNRCFVTYRRDENIGPSVKKQSRHIVGIAGSTTTFLNKFRTFIRSHTPATIETEQHIDPFIAIVRQYIEETSNLSEYSFPSFELYFEMGITNKRYVLDNFFLPAHSNYELIQNRQVIEFSIFIFPAKVGIHGDVLPILFENFPRLIYSMNGSRIPTQQALEDFSCNIQSFRNEPTYNINKSVKMFQDKLLGYKAWQLTTYSYKNDPKFFPKEFVAFFPTPVSFENNLRNITCLPKFYRTMPQQFLHLDTYVEKLLERVKDRRIWLKVLQRGKFILEKLPATYLLEVIKKMPAKEFTRMYRSAKWIEELIEARRHTFIKHVADRSEDQEYLFSDEEKKPYSLSLSGRNFNRFNPKRFRSTFIRSRTGFYFRQIYFNFFNNIENYEFQAKVLKKVLECFRGARILVDRVEITYSPIVNELFEIFQMETLNVWEYKQGLMQVDSLPCSLKKIEANFMEIDCESVCDFIDNIKDFKGILELYLSFENIGDLTEEIKSILMMKKRNPSSRPITIELDIFERFSSSYSFKELFPFSEENFLFHKTIKRFCKMDHTIERTFDYDIFVQRVSKQEVIIVLALSTKSINDYPWMIYFSCDLATNMKRVYELIWETFIQRILKYSDLIKIDLEGNPVVIQEDEIIDGFVYSKIEKKFFAQPSEEVQIPNE